MIAIYLIAVVGGAMFLTFVVPEIKIAFAGRKGFGGMGEMSRGSQLVGGIHINGKPMT